MVAKAVLRKARKLHRRAGGGLAPQGPTQVHAGQPRLPDCYICGLRLVNGFCPAIFEAAGGARVIDHRLTPDSCPLTRDVPVPRSDAKLALMRQRFLAGVSLFDPADPPMPEGQGLIGEKAGNGDGFPIAMALQTHAALDLLPGRLSSGYERKRRKGGLPPPAKSGHNGAAPSGHAHTIGPRPGFPIRRAPVMRQWLITLPDGRRLVVWAHTKSEARAHAKRFFCLPGRLPVGTHVEQMPKEASEKSA